MIFKERRCLRSASPEQWSAKSVGGVLRRWLDIDKPWVDNPAFIVHFAGCGMCSSGFHPEHLGECDVEYIRIFAESFGHLRDAGESAYQQPV